MKTARKGNRGFRSHAKTERHRYQKGGGNARPGVGCSKNTTREEKYCFRGKRPAKKRLKKNEVRGKGIKSPTPAQNSSKERGGGGGGGGVRLRKDVENVCWGAGQKQKVNGVPEKTPRPNRGRAKGGGFRAGDGRLG